jgi:hydroxymethylpyrimidine/phosphomethylpyrimidine kinase
MPANAEVPVALTIAGSDSSAGAGALADLKTFTALGVYGLTAVTCVVAEMPGLVSKIEGITASLVSEQIEVVLRGFPVIAIKTGIALPIVIDPVMVATSGVQLLQDNAIEIYERDLFPLAALITPNLAESARLLGRPIENLAEMRIAVRELYERYRVPFLLKGGHLAGDQAVDLFFAGGETVEFSAPFSRGVVTHGTGCTYSAAITAGLASGLVLREAISRAKRFVTATIVQHLSWRALSGGNVQALNPRPNE